MKSLLIPAICLGGILQKIGVLVFLQNALPQGGSIPPVLMGMLFLPVPLTASIFLLWPLKRPHLNMAVAYCGFGALFLLAPPAYPALFLLAGIGTWLSISIQSSLSFQKTSVIRKANSLLLISTIGAEMGGTLCVSLGLQPTMVLCIFSFVGALIAITFLDYPPLPSGAVPGENGIKNTLINARPLLIVYLSAGIAEAITLNRISEAGMGAEAYGCLLMGHSIASILGAYTTLQRHDWSKALILWGASFILLFKGEIVLISIAYSLLGGLGILLTKEFRVELATSTGNVAANSAFASLLFSFCTASGAIAGATFQ